jgi:N,N-dimethylformamidase
MHRIDPTRLDLAREFKANPLGLHGAELQKLLKIMRWDPINGRVVVVRPDRESPWYLARLSGPKGHPIELFHDRPYATLPDAYWGLFRRRWEDHTGQPLTLDDADRSNPPPANGQHTLSATRRPIIGYADKFSVENGQSIDFKVSTETPGPYHAEIRRLRCGDDTGIGLKTTIIQTPVDDNYPGRLQAIHTGSLITVRDRAGLRPDTFTLIAYIWPTTPTNGRQAILGDWDETTGHGYCLMISASGAVSLVLGDGAAKHEISTNVPLLERHWYLVAASFNAATGEAWAGQRPLRPYVGGDNGSEVTDAVNIRVSPPGHFRIAAWMKTADSDVQAAGHYNGKIEQPSVWARVLTPGERALLLARAEHPALDQTVIACWDFSRDIPSTVVWDVSGNGHHGETVNLPTRAMKGWRWDGSEYNWTHKPEHYGAIHFHDDDLYDCEWATDFTYEVPGHLPSGLYCARLTRGDAEDYVPFVVRPPRGEARADLALLLPTASYWAYANTHLGLEWGEGENVRGLFTAIDSTALFLHEHPEFGCSLYDRHTDGSGVCYSSRLRPVLHMRPRERLWQLPADTHLIDWLEEKELNFDVITEDDLDAEGEALLSRYRCVMTGTHPEYPSLRMLDAFAAFQNQGGRFIYFGGNGFYWRTSYHPTLPGVIEMRRGEDGIRSWLAEGGEYYHGFTGELGGMWRRMDRAPQSVAGTGMTAQGFDRSTHYVRTQDSFNPRVSFIFDGIGADERIGDFGLIGGGAAGSEVDRADWALGTPPHALIIATATEFSSAYHWMKEELTHTHSAINGETCPFVRSDMVFYETPNGGAVFSVSSIAWAGALAHADYTNNVSRITENVIRRFLEPAPLKP